MESGNSKESIDRKNRSEATLRKDGVPLNIHLPAIEAENEALHRSTEEVAYRALALLTVSLKGEGLEQDMVDRIIGEYELEAHLSPKEKIFLHNSSPSQQERAQLAWRYEAAWVMLWALGYVEELDKPDDICDVQKAVQLMQKRSSKQFIADAKPRKMSDILDQADLIYRYHWAVVDARLNGRELPADLEPGVTFERHYALNWLIGYMDQEWDYVSTDT